MAKVLLHSVTLDPHFPGREPVDPDDPHDGKFMQGAQMLFAQSAASDPFGTHTLTDDPEQADLIVFAELGAEGLFSEWVRNHPWVKKYREKTFIFDVGDHTLPFLPGLYASLRKDLHNEGRTRTGYYLRLDENPYIDFRPPPEEYRYLACFVGSLVNHPVRVQLKQVASDRVLIEDTSDFAQQMLYMSPEEKQRGFWPHYADIMASAAFALCPRGRGPGSIRLYEAMRMGRCPVIIADEWIYPQRVDWPACSITVAEADIPRLGEILESKLPRAAELGLQARKEWEKYYSPEVRFHWLVEDCLSILQQRNMPEAIAGRLVWRHLLNKGRFRFYLTSKKQIYKLSRRIVI
ncbi:exostosin family protein [Variovorax sp. J22R24]|uniref:exostosin domain-containing protein n=1 Tax=Variovorax gracilis TaxID=3053502 RepID=UPI0025786A35|nr:exostosin family protein [Variovorax sp. J22R24]MDM0103526.1 exostosin family protein [Variovorax sp. J22R24]